MLTRFVRAWIMQNTAALLAAHVLYTAIAHGITGGHVSRELSVSQLAAHSIARSIVGVLVATAQRRALQRDAAGSSPSWTAGKGAAYEVAVAGAVSSAPSVVLLNIHPEDPAESVVTIWVLCPDHTMLITGSWNP